MIAAGVHTVSVSGSWVPLLGLLDLEVLKLLSLRAIDLLALSFGLLWVLVNFYLFYPLAQTGVQELADGLRARLGFTSSRGIRGDGGTATGDEAEDGFVPEPSIDVLIPAYEEAPVIEQSIANVREARYPQNRISIAVLLEPDDEETKTALEKLSPYYDFDVVTVPERYPGQQGKPRALDYGFERTDGEIVGVIDAEDIVDSGLFREVVRGIVTEDNTVVQGRLDMVNEDDGWLNTVFRGEFGVWFDFLLPAFNRVGYPVPLAGTTCFFRRSALVAMAVKREERFGEDWNKADELWARSNGLFGRSPWSVRNVTEDFELGLFLWLDGHDVGYLDSTTAQESPVRLNNWIRQRTRWEKGKLFTLGQYRHQPTPTVGSKAHLLLLSGLPLLGPINLMGVVLVFLLGSSISYSPHSVIWWVLSIGLAFLLAQSTLYGIGYWTASEKPLGTRLRRTLVTAVTVPVYWVLQWGAVLRAMSQLYHGWLTWERTTHNGRNGGGAETVVRPDTSLVELTRNQRILALSSVLGVGVLLRWVAASSRSLWNDEVYSVAVRSVGSGTDLLVATGDPHPPLYFLLLRGWMGVFGQEPFAVRALSVVLAVGSIVGIYFLGRELFDERVGLIGAFLFGVSTFHVHLGTTARMYELLTMLAVLSWLGFARLERGSVRSTALYLLPTAAMLYTHAVGFLVLLAQYLYLGFSDRHAGIQFRRWGRIQGVLVAFSIPLGVIYWQQLADGFAPGTGGPLGWIPTPSSDALVRTVLGYVGYPSHYPVLGGSTLLYAIAFIVLLIVAGALVLAVASRHPSYGFVLTAGEGTAQMAVLFVVAFLGPFVVSHLVTPVYAPRYTAMASVALLLLVADGVSHVPRRRLQVGAIAILTISAGIFLGGYLTADSAEPWDAATDYLEERAEAGDVLLVQPGWVHPSVEYYYAGPPVEMIRVDEPAALGTAGSDPPPSTTRVWIVRFGYEPTSPGSHALAAYERAGSERFGQITVSRYERVRGDT